MSKGHGKLTVGDLSGQRPAVAAAAASWWRRSGQRGDSRAGEMKGFCCGSGCVGCPWMGSGAGAGAFGTASGPSS